MNIFFFISAVAILESCPKNWIITSSRKRPLLKKKYTYTFSIAYRIDYVLGTLFADRGRLLYQLIIIINIIHVQTSILRRFSTNFRTYIICWLWKRRCSSMCDFRFGQNSNILPPWFSTAKSAVTGVIIIYIGLYRSRRVSFFGFLLLEKFKKMYIVAV